MLDRIELFNQKYGNRKNTITSGSQKPAPAIKYDAGPGSIINQVSSKYPTEENPATSPQVQPPVITSEVAKPAVATSFESLAQVINNADTSDTPKPQPTPPSLSTDIFKKPSYSDANAVFTGENGTELCLCEDSRCPIYEISYKRAPGYPRQLCQKDLDVYENTCHILTGERGYLTLVMYYKGTNKTKYIQKELDKSIQHGSFKHGMTVSIDRVRVVLLHKYDASGNQLTSAAEGLVKMLIV